MYLGFVNQILVHINYFYIWNTYIMKLICHHNYNLFEENINLVTTIKYLSCHIQVHIC